MKTIKYILTLSVLLTSNLQASHAQAGSSTTTPSVSYESQDFPSTEAASKVKLGSAALTSANLKNMFKNHVTYSTSRLCPDCKRVRANVKVTYPKSIQAIGDAKTIFNRKFVVSSDGQGGLNLAESPNAGRTLYQVQALYNRIPVEIDLFYLKDNKNQVSRIKTEVDVTAVLK